MMEENIAENNLISFYRLLGRKYSGMCTFPGLTCVRMPDDSWPSFLLGGHSFSTEDIEKISIMIQDGELPPFWIKRIDNDPGFETLAEGYGLRMIRYWTGMSLEMPASPKSCQLDTDVYFRLLSTSGEMNEWVEIIQEVLISGRDFKPEIIKKLAGRKDVFFFALYQQNKMVSTMMVFNDGFTSGIYLVATRKGEQSKGYASALTSHALSHCFQRGMVKFVLHSTSQGLPLYRKFDFIEKEKFGIFWLLDTK